MIAHRIIACRTRLGLTQAQLARKLHITPSSEGNYEQGRRIPSVDTLILMSKIFDVSLDYLITGSEFIPTNTPSKEIKKYTCPCDSCFWKDYR